VGWNPGPFDLFDGYEYIGFEVGFAAAVHDVVVEQLGSESWVPADGVEIHAYDVTDPGFAAAYGSEPDPEVFEEIFHDWTGRVGMEFSGTHYGLDPGTSEMRYPEVTDLLVIVEYVDGRYIGQYNLADGFVDDGTGVFVGPTLTFPAAPMITHLDVSAEPVPIGTAAHLAVGFTDADMPDSFAVRIDWGDGLSTTIVTDEPGDYTAAHAYAEPGVYNVTALVTDGYGRKTTEQYQFVVVYDPDGGFVTGGGWINSPAGAYTPDPELTGRANFGFVAKYKPGKIVPDGNTNFRFQTAGLHFESTSYDWLVVAGMERAKFKGVGTINGEGSYGFMLTAVDRDDGDTFRIKIWDVDTGDTVYDNVVDDGDDSYDGTVLGGGSIVVHTK
jgi:PKD repeat protein